MRLLPRFSIAAIAALAFATASAGVNTPQSGWYSGNPLLGPNALRDIACGGSTCYASGDFGALLKSTDGGSTWTGIVTGLSLNLRRVGLAGGSPDKVIIASDCALRRSDDGGEHFSRLPFTARDVGCPARVEAFSFPTDKAGYVALADGNFSRPPTAVVAGRGGRIARSPICCASARQPARHLGRRHRLDLRRRSFLDARRVDACRDGETGGGRSAHPLRRRPGLVHLQEHRRRADVDDSSHERRLDQQHRRHRVRRRGPLPHGGGRLPLPDRRRWRFGDDRHSVERPALRGRFRELVPSARGRRLRHCTCLERRGRDVVACRHPNRRPVPRSRGHGPDGRLRRRRAGRPRSHERRGPNWSSVNPPTNASIVSLAGFGPDRVYAYAADGSLERSDNGGQSYSLLNPGTFRPAAIAAVDLDRLLLLGRGVALSTNGGDSFTPAAGKIAAAQLSAADHAAGAVFVYGPARIFRSTDRGTHWREVAKPKRRVIVDLDFVGPNLGYLLDARGCDLEDDERRRQLEVAEWSRLARLPGRVLEPTERVRDRGRIRQHPGRRRGSPDDRRRPQLAPAAGQPVRSRRHRERRLDRLPRSPGKTLMYATAVGGDVGAGSALTIAARPHSRKKPGRVVVSGRLAPADGGEEIVVSLLQNGRWTHRLVTAASNGTFATRWSLRRSGTFVAQVLGDADHRGAGTRPLTVKVR